MSNAKQQQIQELIAARDELWGLLDKLDDHTVIYPGWKKREFFTHVAGWEAMVFEIFYRHLAHLPQKDYHYIDVDTCNAHYVAVRQSFTLEDAKLECEINRFAIITLLEKIEDFSEKIPLPWGENTVTEFLEGAIEHERSHAADIAKLKLPQ